MIKRKARKILYFSNQEAKNFKKTSVVVYGKRGEILVFSKEEADDIREKIEKNLKGEMKRKAFRIIFSKMREVKIDKKGRVLVPSSVLKRALE